jgi:hypothetical protein
VLVRCAPLCALRGDQTDDSSVIRRPHLAKVPHNMLLAGHTPSQQGFDLPAAVAFSPPSSHSPWPPLQPGVSPCRPTFVTIKFDPSQHTSVGEVAEVAAWKLGLGAIPQIRLALFRVSEEAAKPNRPSATQPSTSRALMSTSRTT